MSRWDMAVACHAFSYVLKSDARIWFDSLAKDSISSFEDVKRIFRSKFSQQKKHKKNHVAAHSIKQKDNEASRAFLGQYTDETQQIPGLPESQRISGLLYGCRTRALVEHLSRDLPDTYEALLDKAYVWLDVKDTANSFIYEESQGFKRKEKASHQEDKSGRKNERNRFSPTEEKTPPAVEKLRTYKRERKSGVIDWEEISFLALDTITPSDKPVTVNGRIFEREVHRVYLDSGSACDIMYEHFFDQLSPSIKARLSPPRVPLVGFSGERCWPIGEIDLDFTIREPPLSRTETLDFVLVRSTSQHKILLGRVAMMKMGIIVYTVHQLVKFYTPEGIGTLASTYDREIVIMAIKEMEERPGECILKTREKDPSEEKISINPLFPEQQVTIGGSLPTEMKRRLRKLLQDNIDIFAWEYGDMTSILLNA
ncbi:uncharacterized protein [Rutidosis leptorrhynchoides]|uniref:uncharacterized protein n=1 Tax=Rutidosis leptorrhynchoides TaxID=125765 RepID=UPI003A9A60FE